MRLPALLTMAILAASATLASAGPLSAPQARGNLQKATPGPYPPEVVYVDSSATGANDGTAWADAFTDLQDALAAAQVGGEIWVAQGTYYPGDAGDQSATFQLRDAVAVYGGFDGTETKRRQRSPEVNVTVLSGDINQDDTYGVGVQWWRFGWNANAGNSFHIVTGTGTNATALLDGFTIFAGLAADPALRAGGGLVVNGGSPSIRNCTFQYNALGFGSSAWLNDCDSVFENCVIRDAYACNCGHGGWTSGILCDGSSNVTLLDCEFINHYYVSSQNQGRGAALSADFDCSLTLIGCRFEGNQTGNFYPAGGGTAYGGGVFAGGDVVIDRCEFIDNFAHAGAGVVAWGNATVTNSLFARNRAVSHPNGYGFDDGGYGGGFLTVGSADSVQVSNCTFVDNNTDKGAGMALYGVGGATIRNTIVYHNFADPQEPGEDPIFILKQQIVGDYDVANSCIEGLLQTEPGEDPPDPDNFPGCIDTDPGLVSLATPDYQLRAGSPCIDAGDNTAAPTGAGGDLDGAPRFQDDPGTPDTGVGMAPIVDMGAYEYRAVLALGPGPGDPRLSLERTSLSLSRGGSSSIALRAGVEHAGRAYLILGSTTQAELGSRDARLVTADPYFALTAARSSGFLVGARGVLDSRGEAKASFVLPAVDAADQAGLFLHHVLVVLTPTGRVAFASAPVSLELIP